MTERLTLPSGIVAELQMPDLYGALASVGRVPNPLLAPALDLLVRDKAYTPPGAPDPDVYLRKIQEIRGMYAVAALCLVSPKLRLDLRDGERPKDGEIAPADLSYDDVETIYWSWFRGRRQKALPAAAPADAAGPAGAPPAGDDLPPAAE